MALGGMSVPQPCYYAVCTTSSISRAGSCSALSAAQNPSPVQSLAPVTADALQCPAWAGLQAQLLDSFHLGSCKSSSGPFEAVQQKHVSRKASWYHLLLCLLENSICQQFSSAISEVTRRAYLWEHQSFPVHGK